MPTIEEWDKRARKEHSRVVLSVLCLNPLCGREAGDCERNPCGNCDCETREKTSMRELKRIHGLEKTYLVFREVEHRNNEH